MTAYHWLHKYRHMILYPGNEIQHLTRMMPHAYQLITAIETLNQTYEWGVIFILWGGYNGLAPSHHDVIQWKHFPRYWPFVRGIHRWPVNSPHKGQWRGALMFSLICAWIKGWVNNREAGDLRRHRVHYDVNAMIVKHQAATWIRWI